MNSRGKAVLWAALPLLLLAPLLLWLGKNFERQLADEQRNRTQHTLDLYSGAVQRSLDQMVGKLESLEVFVAGQTAGGRPVDAGPIQHVRGGPARQFGMDPGFSNCFRRPHHSHLSAQGQ